MTNDLMQTGGSSPPEHEPAELPCYRGVPNDIVTACETMHVTSKAVRLEALRRIRDLLAPYGNFKQWCVDHEENYPNVQYQLGQAYGHVAKRPIKETISADWLDAPESATVQSLAERNRELEAQLLLYRSRSAADWAAEARRREEEQALHQAGVDWYAHTLLAIQRDDPTLYDAVMADQMTISEALTRLIAPWVLAYIAPLGPAPTDPEADDLYSPWVTSVISDGFRREGAEPPDETTLLQMGGKLAWADDFLRAEGVTTKAKLAAWVTPVRAASFMQGIRRALPLTVFVAFGARHPQHAANEPQE